VATDGEKNLMICLFVLTIHERDRHKDTHGHRMTACRAYAYRAANAPTFGWFRQIIIFVKQHQHTVKMMHVQLSSRAQPLRGRVGPDPTTFWRTPNF